MLLIFQSFEEFLIHKIGSLENRFISIEKCRCHLSAQNRASNDDEIHLSSFKFRRAFLIEASF